MRVDLNPLVDCDTRACSAFERTPTTDPLNYPRVLAIWTPIILDTLSPLHLALNIRPKRTATMQALGSGRMGPAPESVVKV